MRTPGPHGPGGGDPRLSLRFMATGICALLALGVLLALDPQRLTDPEQTFLPATIALVHVAALGVATSVMIGVLYHFLPAITGSRMRAPAVGRLVWWLYTAATLAFIVSLAAGAMTVVPVAAGVLGTALSLFLAQCADCLLHARRRGPGLAYHAAALVSLAIVAVTGVVLAISLDTGLVRDPLMLLGPKIVLALGGWVGLIVAAVSYRTCPCSTARRRDPGRWARCSRSCSARWSLSRSRSSSACRPPCVRRRWRPTPSPASSSPPTSHGSSCARAR